MLTQICVSKGRSLGFLYPVKQHEKPRASSFSPPHPNNRADYEAAMVGSELSLWAGAAREAGRGEGMQVQAVDSPQVAVTEPLSC